MSSLAQDLIVLSDEQPSVELPIEAFGSQQDKEMESGLIKSIFDNYRLMGSRVLSVLGLREYVCGDDEQCSTLDGTALMIIHLLLVKSLTALAIAALQRNYPAKAKDYVIDKVDSLKSQFKRRASGDWEN